MNTSNSLKKIIYLIVFVASIVVLFTLDHFMKKYEYHILKKVDYNNLNYSNQESGSDLAKVKTFIESEKTRHKQVNIRFMMKTNSFKNWTNVFQTAPLNAGIRMELSEPATLAIIIRMKHGSPRGYDLLRDLQQQKWYPVEIDIDLNKHVTVMIDGEKVLDVIEPDIDYDISEIAVGSGFSKMRNFDGSLAEFQIHYILYKRNQFLAILIDLSKILAFIIVFMVPYHFLNRYASD